MVGTSEPQHALRSRPVWRPDDIDPEWLTAVLSDAGVLGGGRVGSFTCEPVGTGQMGDSFRFTIDVDGGTADALRSVVGKFTAADEQSRSTGVSMRTAEVEVRFYQQLALALPARTARCFHADVDPETARFVLILEDLAPRQAGDQVAGCDVDEAAQAIEQLAKVHGPRWADPALERLDWLNRRDEAATAMLAALFPDIWRGFVERYGERLPEHVLRVGDALFPHLATYWQPRPGAATVQHADYRVDNLLFGGPADSPVAVVDWQTVTLGPGAADVAYFLGGSLDVEDRRRNEDRLLRHYLDVLVGQGVTSYSYDDLWAGYRRHAYAGLVMAVGAAMMVARTDRGDDMFLAMADRAAAHSEDVDAAAMLGS